jgi:hypothetical protein
VFVFVGQVIIQLLTLSYEENNAHIASQVVECMNNYDHFHSQVKRLDVSPEEDLVGGDFLSDAAGSIALKLEAILEQHSLLVVAHLVLSLSKGFEVRVGHVFDIYDI